MNIKNTTKNIYLEKIHLVLLYIEKNYQKDLSLSELAAIASFSKYHFYRVFSKLTGNSPLEYLHRVRLSKSSRKFLDKKNITRVAMESGYSSPSLFSAAFKENYNMTPSQFIKKINEQRTMNMEPTKIIIREGKDFLYTRKEGPYMKSSPLAWETLMKFSYGKKIKEGKSLLGSDAEMIGIGHDNPEITAAEKIRYDACLALTDTSVKAEGDVQIKTIPGGTYAMFLHKGAYTDLPKTYNAISNWIITNEIEARDEPMFEKYLNRDPRKTKPENLRTEIYIPLKK